MQISKCLNKNFLLGKNLNTFMKSKIFKSPFHNHSIKEFSSFNFMNILNNPKTEESERDRYLRLKAKYAPEKKQENLDDENQEAFNYEKVKEKAQDESFLKFLQFLENNETFTWQNNLELMKVNEIFNNFSL